MEPIQALLFDMDGVVIDTVPAIVTFWNQVAAEHGLTLSEEDFTAHIHGVPVRDTLRRLFPMRSPEDDGAFLARIEADERTQTYHEVPGVRQLLVALRERGVPVGLVTSGMPWKVATVMQQLHLDGLLGTVVTAADLPRGKPDPSCYLLGAKRLGIAPSRCLVFEDAVPGVQAARAAGMRCVGVQAPAGAERLREQGAFTVVPDFRGVRLQADGLHLNATTILPLA
jgi:HAD superfamily hydrolase (TIGR01509 family)